MFRSLCLVIYLLTMVSCASTKKAYIEDMKTPIVRIKAAIKASLPMGKRTTEKGARIYYSNYFRNIKGQVIDAKRLSVRSYAKVTILGDRRPYSVEIEVIKQKKTGKDSNYNSIFKDVGRSKAFALAIRRKILKYLSKSRGGSDFIDDFRVF